MHLHIISSWPMLCFLFGVTLFFIFIMRLQGLHFYTNDVIVRKFSILELDMPATPMELANVIKGLYKLPLATSAITITALKRQLYIGFIFMPFAYSTTAILCLQMAHKMSFTFEVNIFLLMAWLQPLALLFDVIENCYLLYKIKPTVTSSALAIHKAYLIMECVKWGIVLISIICAGAAVFYFWVTGNYSFSSLHYLLIMIIEIAVFFVVSKLSFKKKVVEF